MASRRLAGARREAFGGPESSALYDRVWQHAESVALAQHRAATPDDLRHGVHVAALGRDKSSKDLTNAELDRVVQALRLLADPDDLDAMMGWLHPENEERRRRLWWIENRCLAGYARRVCKDMFGTDDWWSLENEPVMRLYRTLRDRPGAMVKRNPAATPAELDPSNAPF